jgi:hypothetical protein
MREIKINQLFFLHTSTRLLLNSTFPPSLLNLVSIVAPLWGFQFSNYSSSLVSGADNVRR